MERTADQFVDLMADDREWMDTLARERYEKSVEALWHSLMCLPTEMYDHLRRECGVKQEDVEAFKP